MTQDDLRTEDNPKSEAEVLVAFLADCPRPSAMDVVLWANRHPGSRDAIIETAAMSTVIEWPERHGSDQLVPPRSLEDFLADTRALPPRPTPGPSLLALMRRAKLDLRGLAARMSIAEGVIASAMRGGVRPPFGRRFVASLSESLGMHAETVSQSLQVSFEAGFGTLTPRSAAIGPRRVSFRQAILASGMAPEAQKVWLSSPKPPTGDSRP